jgi:Vitamin K-dependent gamma-carboxylase
VLAKLKQALRDTFSIDPRSLALMRVLLGFFLLVDLATRAVDLEAFSTDAGVFPRFDLPAPGSLHGSLHALAGGAVFEAALFVLAALVAITLLVGWHARIAVVLTWVLTISLHNRSPAILISGDKVIRLVLFWSLFLPLGARGGLDARRRDRQGENAPVVSLAGALLLLQVFAIYPITVVRKMQSAPWRDLSMVARVMAVDGVTSPLGRLFRVVPAILPAFAAMTILIEAVGPILALTSFKRGKVRTFAVLGMVVFHLLLLGTMLFLGLFPLIMTVAWSVFLPPWFWEEGLPRARRWSERSAPWLARAFAAIARLIHRVEGPPADAAPRVGRFQSAARVTAAVAVASAAALIVADAALSSGGSKRPPTRTAIDFLRLDQDWELYTGVMTNRYHVYAAKLEDGAWVDLHRGGAPLDWNHPRNRPENNRWWKYLLHVVDQPETFASNLSVYLVRGWEKDHPHRRVESIDIVMLERPYGLDERAPSHRISIWHEEYGSANSESGGPVARNDWKVGDSARVIVVVPPDHLRGSACATDAGAAADRCAFDLTSSTPRGDVEASHLLHPFARVDGLPILAATDGLGVAADAGARLGCTFVVSGRIARPRVRWSDAAPWFGTRTEWFAGRLADCKPDPL